jgi:hypothetical protein
MKAKALHQAIYNRINNASVTALLSTKYAPLVSIFSSVPQAANSGDDSYFPFITIGQNTISAYDVKDSIGGSASVQIDIWARSRSVLDIKEIADAVDARLRRQPLTITGATHITTELQDSQDMDDPDGKTLRIMLRYNVLWLT